MTYGKSNTQYLEAEVLSRPKEWLVPLMYEHLLSSLRRAQVQIQAGDFEGKARSLDRANAIVMELLSTLDFEQGGEIASRLSALYGFFAGEIVMVGRSLDTARLGRVIDLIAELHQSWVQVAEAVAPRSRPGGSQFGIPAA